MGEGHAGTGEHTTRIESSGDDASVRDDVSGGGVGDDAVQTGGVQTGEDAQTLFTHTETANAERSLESAAESSKSKPPPPTPVGAPERSTPTTRAQSQSQSSAQTERETPIRLARQLSRQAGDFLQEAGATVTASPAVRRAREGIEKLQSASEKVLPTKRGSFLSKDTGTGNLGVGGRAIRVKEPGTELLACTGHVFVFGDLNYRVDPGAVVAGKWGAMWKKTNGAASGSIAAAVAGLAAKSAKKKAVADAFQATSPSSGKGARPTNAEDLGSNPAGSNVSSVSNTPVAPRSPRLSVASVGSRGAVSGAVTPGGGGSDADDAFNSQAWVEGWRAVATLVENNDWVSLRRGDQLARELRAGLVLHGFREGELGFRPTFKLDVGGGKVGGGKKGGGKKEEAPEGVEEESSVVSAVSKSYSRKRVPSWCDRVVFTSLPGGGSSSAASRVNVVTYGACHGLQTSDHAPVFASLEVACRGSRPNDQLKTLSAPRYKLTRVRT